MRVALVHDHLAQDGGAERVLRVFQELFPQAPTFVLVHDPKRANAAFRGKDIRTSFIQRLPWGVRRYQWYLPLMPTAVESYDLSSYDVVLSSTASFAKGVITRPETLHICYCHTPTRYLWSDTHRYVEEFPTNRLVKSVLPLALSSIRQWDRLAADRVDQFIANSRVSQQRIQKYYHRDSSIIHPPVDVDRFSPAKTVGNYYLIGGRLVAYKRYDMTIHAFNKMGIPLKIFGSGPEYKYLRTIAAKNIEFVGRVSDTEMATLYAQAIAFLNPQEEDFGITTVESMAAGRPVIAYGAGGALETVVPGTTGVFFSTQSWESLADTVIRFRPEDFDSATIQQHAASFATPRFTATIQQAIDSAWTNFQSQRV